MVKDAFSGKTRGFGFIIFQTSEGFEAALAYPQHMIEGQEIHIKPAQVKADESPLNQASNTISNQDTETRATRTKT